MSQENEHDENHRDENKLNDRQENDQIILRQLHVGLNRWVAFGQFCKKIPQNQWINQAREENNRADNQAEAQLKSWIN